MKEATGEVSMTVITLAAVAVIGGILAFMWPTIKNTISKIWTSNTNTVCPAGQYIKNGKCTSF